MLKIQWYPGHMNKAKKKIKDKIKHIDIVIEVRDARIPVSSHNSIINELINNKQYIIILNKTDLALKNETKKWVSFFTKKGLKTISINAKKQNSYNKIIFIINKIVKVILFNRNKKGIFNKEIHCIIIGVSNVGKSTIINLLAKKKSLKVANIPGTTKGNQWVCISKNIKILDTPGLLLPKFKEIIGINLAIVGCISDLVFDNIELAIYIIKKYILNKQILEEEEAYIFLEKYAKKYGCIIKKNKIDLNKGAAIFLKNFKNGKLGNFTLEIFDNNYEI